MIEESQHNEDELNASAYGEDWSHRWNSLFGTRHDTADTIEFLSDEAKSGDVLELGIGTGRIASPLSKRVNSLHGIDNSSHMLREFFATTSPPQLTAEEADMTTYCSSKKYSLVYCVSGTLLAVCDKEKQQQVFNMAFSNLLPEGSFVVEIFSPLGFPVENGRIRVVSIDPGQVVLSAVTALSEEQLMRQAFIFLKDKKTPRVRVTASRYIYPEEIKNMATKAGFKVKNFYSSWKKETFDSHSMNLISVFAKQ